MALAIITGSCGLIGSAAVQMFALKGLDIVGIDNNMRRYFFGKNADTSWNLKNLKKNYPSYIHYAVDIRNKRRINEIFSHYNKDITVVIHTAAQPSHDWAVREPHTDFSINAAGTLNMLESTRKHCPEAVFIFTSTNKVYGDTVNQLKYKELPARYELADDEPYAEHGVDENMSIDQSMHSLFGAGKVAADLLVQEYGRYFGMKTGIFRGGCLTGPDHSAAQLHGFLGYLVRCALTGQPYTVFGHQGKQVRDNIHALDVAGAFWHFFKNPRIAEVYNIGGGRHSNISMLEAISLCEEKIGGKMAVSFASDARKGDHKWWISDVRKFRRHYPEWEYSRDIPDILDELFDQMAARCGKKPPAGNPSPALSVTSSGAE
jgi:CDP-paratose 2-epimerase